MKKKDEVVSQYKAIFGQEKEYLEILQECHQQMKLFKDISFHLSDFKSDEDYKKNLTLIDSFRKYSSMDDFLLNTNGYSLIPLEQMNNFSQKVTYHDIMESIDLFNETFDNMKSFYIPKECENLSPTLEFKTVLTVNDIFNTLNQNQFTVYFIESAKTYFFGTIYDGYEYIYYLPFKDINMQQDDTQNSVVFGYLYLIQEYLLNNYKTIKKDKIYTNFYKEYGVTYEEYLRKPSSENKYVVYNTNLRPFLIEPVGLTYYPRMNQLSFDVVDIFAEKEPQYQDFYQYFKELQFDKEKAEDYVRQNWILNHDIGKIYKIQYNFVGTKEEVERYKEKIIQQKLDDIELNFYMYKKHGLIKYNQSEDEGLVKNAYTDYLKEYLESFRTDKKDFNTEKDNRIDLDTNPIFRIGKSDYLSHEYFSNSLQHQNILINDDTFFGEYKKPIIIQIHLENFIDAYNKFKNGSILEMNYDWYFPYRQLHDYVDNIAQSFCHIRLTSGVREEEFKVLKDIFFYEAKERKKILEHPDFIYDTKKYFIQSANPYYFEIAVILNTHMDLKEFRQIQKGIHPIFKSKKSEHLAQQEVLKLSSSERFLSKKEIVKDADYDVIYTGPTNKLLSLHKGIKGKIISVEKEIIILDELGHTHKETFRSVNMSGWKHLSKLDCENFYLNLTLSEKAFLENVQSKLLKN